MDMEEPREVLKDKQKKESIKGDRMKKIMSKDMRMRIKEIMAEQKGKKSMNRGRERKKQRISWGHVYTAASS